MFLPAKIVAHLNTCFGKFTFFANRTLYTIYFCKVQVTLNCIVNSASRAFPSFSSFQFSSDSPKTAGTDVEVRDLLNKV